ncbi:MULTISPECIES: hypothetical protein [Aeromonas]|uniref:SAP domain-containing protein n=2 Tax=Pseudomonadota TaxID=1224 RepID=A0AAU6TA01_9GAMM|nr:hypothetical protein [Aeromonas sobria]
MGLFDFLKSSKNKEESVVKTNTRTRIDPSNSMPTVKPDKEIFSMPTIEPDKELFECYDEVFNIMITDISGITKKEAKEIHDIIKKCDGGFLNMSGYYSVVWDKYFKGRYWQWDEYDEWNAIFTKLGRFPGRFPKKEVSVPATSTDVLSTLLVSDLKTLCIDNQLSIPPKSKKSDLIELLKSAPNISSMPLVSSKIDELNSRFEHSLYELFMRTISFRGHDLHKVRRAKRLGVKKYEIMHAFEEDKEFVEMALKIKPNALHPVFPSDMSMRKMVLPF